MKKGKLFIVPTPIGNLKDITLRAIETLQNVTFIGAEDTRHTAILMKKFQIDTPLFSYHKFNERSRVEKIITHLDNGEDIALVSDAGMPAISDPAALVIREVISAGFMVETLPGASSIFPALISSGLDCDKFLFLGFLPNKQKEKIELLISLKNFKYSIVLFEAPHRLLKTLDILLKYLGNRRVVIARELTKIHETFYRGDLQTYTSQLDLIILKGEIVIVLDGADDDEYSDDELQEKLSELIKSGFSKKEVIQKLSQENGISKNKLYDLSLKL
jgi:16S rRNA (cytidine1402-2'-O)-methyltransferase